MALGLDAVLGTLSVIQGIAGLFGASSRRRRAEALRQQLLAEHAAALDAERQALMRGNLQALQRASGILNDVLTTQASGLGDVAARAGIYNSTAVLGAIRSAAERNAAALADLAARNYAAEQALHAQQRQSLLGRQLAIAQERVEEARQEHAGALQSLVAGLTAFGQEMRRPTTSQQYYQQLTGELMGRQYMPYTPTVFGSRANVLPPPTPIPALPFYGQSLSMPRLPSMPFMPVGQVLPSPRQLPPRLAP